MSSSNSQFRRRVLEELGLQDIPPVLDTATFRKLSLIALDVLSSGGGISVGDDLMFTTGGTTTATANTFTRCAFDAGEGAYTRKLVLPTEGRSNGDVVVFLALVSGGSEATVEVRNATDAGTTLFSYTAHATDNGVGRLEFIFNGTKWIAAAANEMFEGEFDISVAPPTNTSPPTIAGNYIGVALSSTNGAWTGSPSFTYQWQISDDGVAGWSDIDGATSSTYAPVEADETKFVRLGVTASNLNGSVGPVYSAASSEIEPSPFGTLASGLLAFWKLDDLTDASGNGNTLTNNNGVTFGAGKIGNGAVAGAGSYLTANIVNSFSSGAWSFSWWFTRSTQTGTQFVARVGGGNGLDFYSGPSHGDGLQLYAGVAELYGGLVPADTFVHAVVTWDGAGSGAVYFNGSAVATFATNLLVTAGNTASFGSSSKFDAIGFWNRALSTEEVAQLYNGGAGLEITG